jgi:hypothetical protein
LEAPRRARRGWPTPCYAPASMAPTSRKKLGSAYLLAWLAFATACTLNPQPEPPGAANADRGGDAGPGGFPSGSGSTGSGSGGAGGSGPAGAGGGGGGGIIVADSGAPTVDAGADSSPSALDAALGDTGVDSGTPADAGDAASAIDGSDAPPANDGGEPDTRPE